MMGRHRVMFFMNGTVRLLLPAQAIAEMGEYMAAVDDDGKMEALVQQFFEPVLGVPEAAEGGQGRVVPIQRLLLSYLCSTGGTMWSSRAPRAGVVAKLLDRKAAD